MLWSKHRSLMTKSICLAIVSAALQTAHAEDEKSTEINTTKGTVTKVIDGDSIVIKTDDGEESIFLDGIDAPEYNQDGGPEATSFLRKLIKDEEVEVKWEKRDKFKRILGTVFLKDENVNVQMVAKGWAWHYKMFNKSKELEDAQKEAKSGKLGIWKEDEPKAPWDFRRENPSKEKSE